MVAVVIVVVVGDDDDDDDDDDSNNNYCHRNSRQTAIELVQEIGKRTTVITQDTRETVFLFQ